METITETIITESTMIGHNPSTPGGIGVGVGVSVLLNEIDDSFINKDVIALVPENIDFESAAFKINQLSSKGVNIKGAIIQKDDAVLINNRLNTKNSNS